MRLIDADALKREINESGTDGTIANYVRGVLAATLDRAPTVDAVPVRYGLWSISDDYLICSACGERYHVPSLKYSGYTGFVGGKLGRLAYCPNCGAKMDGEDEG